MLRGDMAIFTFDQKKNQVFWNKQYGGHGWLIAGDRGKLGEILKKKTVRKNEPLGVIDSVAAVPVTFPEARCSCDDSSRRAKLRVVYPKTNLRRAERH